MERKPTFHAMHSADSFIKFPSDEAIIQNQTILMNIKKKIPNTEHEYDHLEPLDLTNDQTRNLVNIKNDPDSIKSEQCDNTGIFSGSPLSKICRYDVKDSMKLDIDHLSTVVIKHK